MDDVDVVAELAREPDAHASAGQVVAVCGSVAGERIIPSASSVADAADQPVGRDPQRDIDRRATMPDCVGGNLVDRNQEVLENLTGTIRGGQFRRDGVPQADEVRDVPCSQPRRRVLQRLRRTGSERR
jgi:hypothetical protein